MGVETKTRAGASTQRTQATQSKRNMSILETCAPKLEHRNDSDEGEDETSKEQLEDAFRGYFSNDTHRV